MSSSIGDLMAASDSAKQASGSNTFLPRLLSLLLHRWPFKRGESRIQQHPLISKAYAGECSPFPAKLRNGYRIFVDTADQNGQTVALFGAVELNVSSICRKLLNDGDVFLDIGANYGAVGLNMTEKVGSTGRVHLFEPQPKLTEAIERCIVDNAITNVQLHKVGLLDKDGTATLSLRQRHSGGASFVRDQDDGQSIDVPIKETYSYIRPIVCDRPFAAKVDIEGAEHFVIPGLLMLPRFRFLVFECNTPNQRQTIYRQLTAHEVALFGVPQCWITPRLIRIRKADAMKDFLNLFAARVPGNNTIPDSLTLAEMKKLLS